MDLTQFLTWLATSAGASVAFSFISERIPAFQKLTAQQKSLLHLAGALLFALTAYAVQTYVPADALAQIAPVFQLVYGVVYTWIAGQVAHAQDPAAFKTVTSEPAKP